jgi:hypothetical protein
MLNRFVFLLLGFALLSRHAFAISFSDLRIVASDGTFLGTLESKYASNSIYNKYGSYGSRYAMNCVFNRYGNYGSDYSAVSPFNRYGSKAPGLYDRSGNFYGTLSVNRYAQGVTHETYELALELKAYRDSLWEMAVIQDPTWIKGITVNDGNFLITALFCNPSLFLNRHQFLLSFWKRDLSRQYYQPYRDAWVGPGHIGCTSVGLLECLSNAGRIN